ncbi:hypothetical protein FSP39_020222 [Pinctada imbricata]|uniref:Hypoxia-inducible factor 1-alpha n=1 Tax=Pinctada imbricata TaxID=66713 RepID=A0AA88XXN3_PINIB|nr:hypothetical protein FSP39_020222 [Pinctada imbricata]
MAFRIRIAKQGENVNIMIRSDDFRHLQQKGMRDMGGDKNSEKRKEKSRDAARCRRSKETEIFTELSREIPVYNGSQNQLDKASVMRLAISHLKMRKIMDKYNEDGIVEDKLDSLYSKALEGFLLLLSEDGDIIYVSDNVAKYLGIVQVDLIGQSIFEFAHPRDHDEVTDIFSKHHGKKDKCSGEGTTFFMRMKCTLTSKGKSVNLKSASYKVLKFAGKMVHDELKVKNGSKSSLYPFLLLIGEPVPHPSNIEIPLDGKTFLTRHNMDMTFTYCDERMTDLIGYESEELMDQSLYMYHHAADSETLDKAYKDLFSKGQTMTGQYRFLARGGGYVWVVTQGTVITNSRTQKPQCVVCVHYVISNIEDKGAIISEVQKVKKECTQSSMTKQQKLEATPLSKSDIMKPSMEKSVKLRQGGGGARPKIGQSYRKEPEVNLEFKRSTEDVFANSKDFGFILSTENVLKPRPQNMKEDYMETKTLDVDVDLTHLAPTAGDVCIPLPCNAPYVINNPQMMPTKTMKQEPDMFPKSLCRNGAFNQMGSNPNLLSPHSVSPAILSPVSSPADYQTMVDPSDMSQDMAQLLTSMETSNMLNEDNEVDLDTRAPYIPMNVEADFSLVAPTTDALFSLNSDFDPGTFGGTEKVFTSRDKILPDPPKEQRMTLRDMLGESTVVAAIEQIPETRLMQMKRPLDMNSLEKGPPIKRMKGMVDNGQKRREMSTGMKSSVLMNLLRNGEDRTAGYSVSNKLPIRQSIQVKPSGVHNINGSFSLPCITPQEIEANTSSNNSDALLLQGADLMHYLESLIPRSSLM